MGGSKESYRDRDLEKYYAKIREERKVKEIEPNFEKIGR